MFIMVKLVKNDDEVLYFNSVYGLYVVSILLIFVIGLLENDLLLWM